jgi:hypothetical protein
VIPGFELFGIVGTPAIDCAEAGFWLSGQLGGELGTLLRKKFLSGSDVTSGIAGTWTLDRTTVSCVHLKTCQDNPMTLKITGCSAHACTLTRLNSTWRHSHLITLKNGSWTGRFTDFTASCGTRENPAQVTLTLTVTSYGKNSAGRRVARTLGGTYAVSIPTNPPDCTPAAHSFQDLYGGRSLRVLMIRLAEDDTRRRGSAAAAAPLAGVADRDLLEADTVVVGGARDV